MNSKNTDLSSLKDESNNIIKKSQNFLIPSYDRFPLIITHGKGCYIYDKCGNEYLDFYGGHAVSILGHSHPSVVEAICNQAKQMMFYSNIIYHEIQIKAAEALVNYCQKPGGKVFFCNSGAEANENALKIARNYTNRSNIVAFKNSFHGRTTGAIAVTGIDKYHNDENWQPKCIKHIDYNKISHAENAIDSNTAAVILEPIQSMAGIVEPDNNYIKQLSNICKKNGTVLIFDEVQTGLGRTGFPTAAQTYNVIPDMQTFAKGLGSGIAVGAVLANEDISISIKPGDLGSTFGGGQLACAAVNATINELKQLKSDENAQSMEQMIKNELSVYSEIKVIGRGLLLGIVFNYPAKIIRDKLLAKGILTGTSLNPNVLRLLPPLTISEIEVTKFTKCLSECLGSVQK